jgi:hypothetical protein
MTTINHFEKDQENNAVYQNGKLCTTAYADEYIQFYYNEDGNFVYSKVSNRVWMLDTMYWSKLILLSQVIRDNPSTHYPIFLN